MRQFAREIGLAVVVAALGITLGVLTLLTLRAKRKSKLYKAKVWVLGALVGLFASFGVTACEEPMCYDPVNLEDATVSDAVAGDTTSTDTKGDDSFLTCYMDTGDPQPTDVRTDSEEEDVPPVMCYEPMPPDSVEPADTVDPADTVQDIEDEEIPPVMCYDPAIPTDTVEPPPADVEDDVTDEDVPPVMCYDYAGPEDTIEPAPDHDVG